MSTETVRPELLSAIEAAQNKKAGAITLLDLTGLGAFTDYFLLCSGYSTPQVQAISEAVEEALKARGLRPQHREGRSGAEWLLLDYGFLIVHILSERLRAFYDLERLWRMARRIDFGENEPGSALGRTGNVAEGGSS
ncbi:MAG TPA: ribosome silencing factor [Candidatus Acidoferrales bacterium]|nr:ribosome silencing factor [Candidatus Acidoferrales bacterium]